MKRELANSSITIPIPTELYLALLDSIHARGIDEDPIAVITAVIRKQIVGVSHNSPRKSPKKALIKHAEKDWSDDWITPQSPLVEPQKTKASLRQTKNRRTKSYKANGSDWCIGCGCPSPDLIT